MNPHLLIVDDDERIRSLLQQFLIQSDYLVSTAENAKQAITLLSAIEFDLIILDVMMPGQDGISFTAKLRNLKNNTPILLLTARGEIEDRIKGLEAGADDYLPKPFEPKELLLRINAILRRMADLKEEQIMPKTLNFGNLKYDVARNELWEGEDQIRLTTTESQLMKIFTSALGEPISRANLVTSLGKAVSLAQDRAIDVQITRLRRKIEVNPSKPRYLQTVRGAGYMLLFD
ncbi:MAG: response regulator [Rhodobacteraceae bacterium]|jgi:two-component system phosphate regulon response regulator OmpR|nr:MAG: response regulator [Paracoccaceae bacterium]|tara:strand:+ start:841 stop:1536 length:696 start_codon:yes stop_codon:yes gene_type:complete